ncbi:MAG: hypothetical protein RQ847_10905, partial [Wenzhouxiangellaceae bacterium]|nr:hypothetical protein [Wenzhouxiangellaceae bacterium]
MSAGQVSIPEGVLITGGEPGATRLRISTEGAVLLDTGVFVASAAGLEPGDWEFFARPVGVRKQRPVVLTEFGPIVNQLGVMRETDAPPPVLPATIAATPLSVARGPVLTGVAPEQVSQQELDASGQTELRLLGFGLDAVDQVEILPEDGVTAGAVAPASDGESVTVTLTVAPDAALGSRRAIARIDGRIVRAVPGADHFYLAGDVPRIDSIDPIVINPGNSATLTVRGANFSTTSQLSISPASGVTIDQPITISPAGDRIQAVIHVAPDAAAGPRLVQVSSAAGQSSAELSSANTLSVILGELATFPLFDTRHLRVFKGEPQTGLRIDPVSAAVGVGKGSLVTEIEPRLLETGGQRRLLIAGQGLDQVSELIIAPSDGLGIGPVSGSDDLLEVFIDTAADAPNGLRELAVMTPGGPMTLARPELGTIRVVSPQPIVAGVSPVYLEPGAPATEVTISGQNFQQAEAVRVLPQTDLTLGSFTVAADGREIKLPIAAGSTAETGPRTVQVETPAGISSDEQTSANRLYIGNPQERLVTPLLAPLLGVQREAPPIAANSNAYGPLLGVLREFVDEVEIGRAAFSDRLLVAKGPVLFGIEPAIVPRGFAGELIVPGVELSLDTQLAIESGEGIEITGPAVVESDEDGMPFVRLPIAVADTAPAIVHRLLASEASGDETSEIRFITPHASRFQIAGDAPVIESISPVITLPDRRFTLLIRGFNFEQATEVRVIPD